MTNDAAPVITRPLPMIITICALSRFTASSIGGTGDARGDGRVNADKSTSPLNVDTPAVDASCSDSDGGLKLASEDGRTDGLGEGIAGDDDCLGDGEEFSMGEGEGDGTIEGEGAGAGLGKPCVGIASEDQFSLSSGMRAYVLSSCTTPYSTLSTSADVLATKVTVSPPSFSHPFS